MSGAINVQTAQNGSFLAGFTSQVLGVTDYLFCAQRNGAGVYNEVLVPFSGAFVDYILSIPQGSGSRFEIQKDSSPLNYSGTHAAFVVQQTDPSALGNNVDVPGAVFQFTSTGNGYITGTYPNNYSNSVWQGMLVTMTKYGDASGQCISTIGQLEAYGTGQYNELGLFCGINTNLGSTNGNLSGVEVVVADNNGITSYDTRMKSVIARINRNNAGTNQNVAFMASTEGTAPPDAILVTNTQVTTNSWKMGLDLSAASFTTGVAIALPNTSNISWINGSGTLEPVISVSNSGVAFVRPSSVTGTFDFQNFGGTVTDFRIDAYGNVVMNPLASSPLTAGATYGFLYVPTINGPPTGSLSVTYAGAAPMVIDETNNKVWFRVSGGWKGVTVS